MSPNFEDMPPEALQKRGLAAAGASSPDKLVGHIGRLAPLFPIKMDLPTGQSGPILKALESASQSLLLDVPIGYLTALRFVLNDIYKPLNKVTLNVASGRLNLGSLYGDDGLRGDHAEEMRKCMRSPWDPMRFWVQSDFPDGSCSQDILRLHRLLFGSGAPKSERYFRNLPTHLGGPYFKNGELRLNTPILPDARSDGDLLLSQFHAAMELFHNSVADKFDWSQGCDQTAARVFKSVQNTVRDTFCHVLFTDVLPRICDPEVIAWSKRNGAPVFKQSSCAENSNALPQEALALLTALSALLEPKHLLPNLVPPNAPISLEETKPMGRHFVLADKVFTNPQSPMRLTPKYCVDWQCYLDGGAEPVQTLRTTGTAKPNGASLANLISMMETLPMPTAKAVLKHIKSEFDLALPQLSDTDIQRFLEPEDANRETPLLVYLFAEANLLGTNGRLGPLGSLMLYEAMKIVAGPLDFDRPKPAQTLKEMIVREF